MQATANALKTNLWSKLETVYNKYAQAGGEIPIAKVEEIIVDVLHEESQAEIDYVTKNLFRLDQDGSGSVSFI